VTGEITPDGIYLLHQAFAGGGWDNLRFRVADEGKTLTGTHAAAIAANPRFNLVQTVTLTRTDNAISVPLVALKVYRYSVSKTLRDALHGSQLDAGPIVVDSAQNLLLSTETAATATFDWHVTFNSIATKYAGITGIHGKGRALFGKQPDNAWTLVEQVLGEAQPTAQSP
jgi:hypothetical protein